MADTTITLKSQSTDIITQQEDGLEIVESNNATIIELDDSRIEIVEPDSHETELLNPDNITEITSDLQPEEICIEECGGGGTAEIPTYTNSEPTPETVGGIPAGSTFSTVALLDMWTDLLYPFQAPQFTAFAMAGRTPLLEVGDTLTGGIKTFTWSISNDENIKPDTIQISSTTRGVLASGLAHDGTEDIDIGADITKTDMFTEVFTIRAETVQDTFISRTISTAWRWNVYHGESENETLTENEIEALNSTLKNTRAGTYEVSPAGYKYVSWPVIFGVFATMKDPDTNQDVAVDLPVTTSVTNTFGVQADYYVYRTTYYQNGALTMVVT